MVGEIQVSLKSNKNKGYFTWTTVHIYNYVCVFFLEWKMFQAEVVEKIQKKGILGLINFFPKTRRLWNNLENEDTAVQVRDDNKILAMGLAYWTNKAAEEVVTELDNRRWW